MKHPILDQHDVIAWDMDKTLVDGPNSEFFRAYIRANPRKRHHIVTFRGHLWALDIPAELERHGLDPDLIYSIAHCPDECHDTYMVDSNPRNAKLKDSLIKSGKMTFAEMAKATHDFLRFKGKAAKELGCGVLVDDMPEWVMPGVEENGIAFVNALDPITS